MTKILRVKTAFLSDPKKPEALSRSSCDIKIKEGRIQEIGDWGSLQAEAIEEIHDQILLPGLVDSQVHFRDPGSPEKEDFHSGSKGAVLGGVTAVFDMPNTKPNTSTVERFIEKRETVEKKTFCDFGLFAGATNDNSAELPAMEKLEGCCGVKIFMGSSTGDLLVAEDEFLARVLKSGQRMISVHCEDEETLVANKSIAIEGGHPRAHPHWRNMESALKATQRIVRLAKEHQRRIHVLHITTKEELDFLKDNKDVTTVEILPQHMYFKAPDCYEKLGSLAQMNPPIRSEEHQVAIKKALVEGIVDVVASDHAPHTLEEKQRPYPQSPSGLVGVQTIVPVMLNFVNQGLIDLERLCHLMSINPCRIFKAQRKGGIYVGQDADFTLVDMDIEKTVDNKEIVSRAGWSPYHGDTLKGWPTGTMIRGEWVMKNGQVLKQMGRPIEFAL